MHHIIRGLVLLLVLLGTLPAHASAQAGAVLTVTATEDAVDGQCDTHCTLREALVVANATPGPATIVLSAATYVARDEPYSYDQWELFGDYDVTDAVTITGVTSATTVINMNSRNRGFEVQRGSLTLINVTVMNGVGVQEGAGIASYGDLTLINVTLANNGAAVVGGLLSTRNTTIIGSRIRANRTTSGGEGGIRNTGTMTITASRIDGNSAGSNPTSCGGGIGNSGTLTIRASAIVENGSTYGGGICNRGDLTLENTTISNNAAATSGAGLFNSGRAQLRNVTVAANRHTAPASNSGASAGIDSQREGTIELANTLIAGNKDQEGNVRDCNGTLLSQGYNLIERAPECSIVGDTTGNITERRALLSALYFDDAGQDIQRPRPGSPAIDAGSLASSGPSRCTSTDQRGYARAHDGDGDGLARCDIGALEIGSIDLRPGWLIVDPVRRLIETPLLRLRWAPNNSEWLREFVFAPLDPDLNLVSENNTRDFNGSAWGFPEAWLDGPELISSVQKEPWVVTRTGDTASITIDSWGVYSSGGSKRLPVHTTYEVSGASPLVSVARTFRFTENTLWSLPGFRPYTLRLLNDLGFTHFALPLRRGGVLSGTVEDCPGGCQRTDWDSTWATLSAPTLGANGVGVTLLNDTSYRDSLWIDTDHARPTWWELNAYITPLSRAPGGVFTTDTTVRFKLCPHLGSLLADPACSAAVPPPPPQYPRAQCTDAAEIGAGATRPQPFIDAYTRNGGKAVLGCTAGPAGGTGSWVTTQPFVDGLGNTTAMIVFPAAYDQPLGSLAAYVVRDDILAAYLANNGPTRAAVGLPTSDQFTNARGQQQSNFFSGFMVDDGITVTTTSWPTATLGTWRATYYNAPGFIGGPTWVQTTSVIADAWGSGAPGGGTWGVRADQFAARWTGTFTFIPGDYVFTATTSPGDNLHVFLGDAPLTESSGGVTTIEREMVAGQARFRVEFVEGDGEAAAGFTWRRSEPQPCAITINNGARFTAQRDVVLRVSAPKATEMKVANDSGAFLELPWQTFVATTTWTLADPGNRVVTLNAYALVRNAQQNFVCGAGGISDDIIYDPVPPTVATIHLARVSRSPTHGGEQLVVQLDAADQEVGSGLAGVQVSTDPAFAGASWQPFSQQFVVPASPAQTLYVRVRDGAGNLSSVEAVQVPARLPKPVFLPLLRH